jgi:hypothetical protein
VAGAGVPLEHDLKLYRAGCPADSVKALQTKLFYFQWRFCIQKALEGGPTAPKVARGKAFVFITLAQKKTGSLSKTQILTRNTAVYKPIYRILLVLYKQNPVSSLRPGVIK